jgi:hypothetical protein
MFVRIVVIVLLDIFGTALLPDALFCVESFLVLSVRLFFLLRYLLQPTPWVWWIVLWLALFLVFLLASSTVLASL